MTATPEMERPCHGMTAWGACSKQGKYRVNDETYCGIHLAQGVRRHMTYRDKAVVTLLGTGDREAGQ